MEHSGEGERTGRELFGQIAVRRGFVSAEHVHEALKIQQDLTHDGKRPLIGIILMELGMLSTTEMIDVLQEVHRRTRRVALASLPPQGR